jgi:hypothetical protein
MVETFTPAVCGSRRRRRLALVGFAAGAVLAAAALGALLGLVGELVGARQALPAIAALALLAAAREAGLVRLPLPQSRRQVPEAWRFALPLPVWSFGYGAGLGVGVATFQPFATFWIACAGAVALASPVAAAACFSLYGAGRALMTALPRGEDATMTVERLAGRRAALRRTNVAVLAVCAVLLATAPAAGAAVSLVGPGLDPSVSARVLAHARLEPGGSKVDIRPPTEPVVEVNAAAQPSIDGDLIAYVDSGGIRVVNWRANREVARIAGNVSKPSLNWPLLAFCRVDSAAERLVLADFTNSSNPTERAITRVPLANDLGRPSLKGGRLAWHRTTARKSRILVQTLSTGSRRVVARSVRWLLTNPSLTATRIVWIEQRSNGSSVRHRRLSRTRVRTLMSVKGRNRLFWTTAMAGRTAFVTRWWLSSSSPTLYRVNF